VIESHLNHVVCDVTLMALFDDLVTLVLLASAGFFVALSIGLLVRHRQVSQIINASSDVGHDLWAALEQRMKKQDERIIDVMGRLEVVQSRMMSAAVAQPAPPAAPPAPVPEQPAQPEAKPSDVMPPAHEMQQPQPPASQPESHLESRESQAPPVPAALDETQLAVIRLLAEGQKNTRQLTDALKKSREHTARLMKGLFELGLVLRNNATKPFVYQLTDEGRRRLQPGP
jgi:outer membrane biosynthesis protein TonB